MSPNVALVAQYSLGSVFMLAAVLKVLAPPRRDAISRLIPRPLVRLGQRALVLLEAVLGAGLLSGIALPVLLGAATVMTLGLLLGAIGLVLSRARGEPCGCFGDLLEIPVGWPLVGRNLALVVLSIVALGSPGGGSYAQILAGVFVAVALILAPMLTMLAESSTASSSVLEDSA